jgi:hypothetical protein
MVKTSNMSTHEKERTVKTYSTTLEQNCMLFEVHTAVAMMSANFCDVTELSSAEAHWRVGGTYSALFPALP